MRIEKSKLLTIKADILTCIKTCKNYHNEYYFISNKLYDFWSTMKANYFKRMLLTEKLNNERLFMEIGMFLDIIDEINQKYSDFETIDFSIDFDSNLSHEINNIINKYSIIKNKLNLISTSNQIVNEKKFKSITFIDRSVKSYDEIKARIYAKSIDIKEIELYIKSKISNYHVSHIDISSNEIKTTEEVSSLKISVNKMRIIKNELSAKYRELNDEIDVLIEKLESVKVYYNTNNLDLLTEKLNLIKINLDILDSNFVNNINLLNNEIDEQSLLTNAISQNAWEMRHYE